MTKSLRRLLLFMFFIAVAGSVVAATGDYPARCRTTTELNVRSNPTKNSAKIGLLPQYEYITVEYTTGSATDLWGAVKYDGRRGYVSMRYVNYVNYIGHPEPQNVTIQKKPKNGILSFLSGIWMIIKWILIVVAILLVLAFREEIISVIVYLGMFAGGGAILFVVFSGNGGIGALVGLAVGVILGLRLLVDQIGGDFNTLFLHGYYFFSLPIYWLNQLEHFLVEPWRIFFKRPWVSDDTKKVLRVVFDVLSVILYIAITPLRLLNAIINNIFIHCVAGIYDLMFEVFMPCDPQEGADNIGKWILLFPWRLLKYPIGHGLLTIIESVLWTVVDIFVPSITMYHGTKLSSCELIVRDTHRNKFLRKTSRWTCGTFMASTSHNNSWGGKGVYFASSRLVARGYGHRAGTRDQVMIACRVSLGRVINYALTSNYVFRQTGPYGRHSELNNFGKRHHYTTGEWWNDGDDNKYWEYCLFDEKDRYDHPWRIRPIYVLNYRTGRAQHISGGMQHWLFDKAVMEDLLG